MFGRWSGRDPGIRSDVGSEIWMNAIPVWSCGRSLARFDEDELLPPLHEIIVLEDLSDTKILKGSVEGSVEGSVRDDYLEALAQALVHQLWCISCGGWYSMWLNSWR
jgi:hypothetical protein